uniref:C-type lectin domain-containing protein n=1 Tax=Periophthalmus magnuspinnatus TaxID=409849 RepID=A0A3B4AFV5_9GOBI
MLQLRPISMETVERGGQVCGRIQLGALKWDSPCRARNYVTALRCTLRMVILRPVWRIGTWPWPVSLPHVKELFTSSFYFWQNNYTSEGWLYFQGSVYLGSTTEQTWQESRQYCQKRGADLTIISSVQEQKFAHSTFKGRRWIGLSDLEQEGVWKWVDGSLVRTRFWTRGEPNNLNNEDCGEMNFKNELKNWNDHLCTDRKLCICEKRLA